MLYFIAVFIIYSGNDLSLAASFEIQGLAGLMFLCSLFITIKKEVNTNPVALLSTHTQLFPNVLLPQHFSELQTLPHLCRGVKHKRQIWISCHILRTLCFITLDDCVAGILNETHLTALRETPWRNFCSLDKWKQGTEDNTGVAMSGRWRDKEQHGALYWF